MFTVSHAIFLLLICTTSHFYFYLTQIRSIRFYSTLSSWCPSFHLYSPLLCYTLTGNGCTKKSRIDAGTQEGKISRDRGGQTLLQTWITPLPIWTAHRISTHPRMFPPQLYNLISSHLTPPHSISLHFTSFHLTLLHLIPSHSTSPHSISLHSISFYLTSFYLTPLHLIPSHSTPSHSISPHSISFHLTPLHLILSHLTPPHSISLISPHSILSHHLILYNLTSFFLNPSHITAPSRLRYRMTA